MNIKICNKCKQEKTTADFGSDSSKKDKLRTICRKCSREYDRKRGKTEKRKIYMKKILAEYKKSDKAAESIGAYRKKYPKKAKAHNDVYSAIRNKTLIREPCEECGDHKSNAHHDDYDKPLSVRWLCNQHHRKWHVDNGSGLNAN